MGDVTLQPRTISTVKATAPVLREYGLEITQRMYALLFQDEQIKSLFNQSHHRVVAAWTEAYEFLAQVLMAREQELYDQRATAPGLAGLARVRRGPGGARK